MSQKAPRSVREFQEDICEVAQKIGLLQYQMEREIPKELEKLFNRMHDLDNEGKKFLKSAEQTPVPPKPEDAADIPVGTIEPALALVPDASN